MLLTFRLARHFGLASVVACCFALVSGAIYSQSPEDQTRAIAAMKRHSANMGHVTYRYEVSGWNDEEMRFDRRRIKTPGELNPDADGGRDVVAARLYFRASDWRNPDLPFDDAVEHLAIFPKIRHLELCEIGKHVRATELSKLSCGDSLQNLEWRGKDITDEQFAVICGWTNLQSLTIECEVYGRWRSPPPMKNIQDFSRISRLQKLRRFRGDFVSQTDDFLESLSKNTGLQFIELKTCDFTDYGAAALANLPELRHLDLRGSCRLTQDGIRKWANLRRLESVRFEAKDMDEKALAVVVKLPALKELELSRQYVEGHAFTVTDAGNAIETLSIGGDRLTRGAWNGIAQFPKLRTLRVHSVADGAITLPPGFHALQECHLIAHNLTPDLWGSLGRLSHVTSVTIDGKWKGDFSSTISQIPGPQKMKQLKVANCKVSREALIKLLALNSKLEFLDIRSIGKEHLSEADVNAVQATTRVPIESFYSPIYCF